MLQVEIEERLAEIKSNVEDNEIAHRMEDGLFQEFIEYVAQFYEIRLGEKARLVLTSRDIKFNRYCR